MTEVRQWSPFEDEILKKIRDDEGVQKWSTIAQKMAEQYGIKGRNGKQCKQRYMEVFDVNNEVLHWDYESEQKMFILHDQLGNKWAAIGQQLQNRTDNDVKNHFYSKIRKGLRKLNKIIKDHLNKKQFREIKPTVLYKLIEGAQDRFISQHVYEEDVRNFCVEAKNTLLMMSYDELQHNPWDNFEANEEIIKEFIENLSFFSKEFKRKPKSHVIIGGRRVTEQENMQASNITYFSPQYNPQKPTLQNNYIQQNMFMGSTLSPHVLSKNDINSNRGHSICNDSEVESQGQQALEEDFSNRFFSNNSPFVNKLNSSEHFGSLGFKTNSPSDRTKINPVIILKSSNEMKEERRGSINGNTSSFSGNNSSDFDSVKSANLNGSLENRRRLNEVEGPQGGKGMQMLPSIPKLFHTSSKVRNSMIDEEEENELGQSNPENSIEKELMKNGILEEEVDNPCQIFSGKNITSRGSNFSSYSIEEEEEVHFFDDDSTLNMRIYTTGVGGKRNDFNLLECSLEKSDKLFKSNDKGQFMFESSRSQNKNRGDLEMSIEDREDMGNSNARQNSLFQSVGR